MKARLASKEEAMPSKVELGKRVREERNRQALTLKAVEGRSGVSATHISQIERGITWPTVNALDKIARALKKNTSFFLEEVELPDMCRLSGNGSTMILSENPKVVLRSLSFGIPGGRIKFYVLTAHPTDGKDRGEIVAHCHEGDECGYVLSGRIELKVGDEIVVLKPGESVHFNGTKPHGIRNVGHSVSESVWAAWSIGV
jgi:mannose-6-phosphate isomerase-like protein (cupin superfamily)